MGIHESTMRFAALFDGLQRAFGVYKNQRAKTLRQEVTIEDFDKHISGECGIGIVPINEGNMCHFAAIDIDEDTIDHKELKRQVEIHKMPLIVCRSKSGGAHLYTFMAKPAPARTVRKIMAKWSADLGYGASEIFPKQNALEKTGVGNWINLPYFDAFGTDCLRYAVADDGMAMPFAGFLELAEKMANSNDIESYDDGDLEPDGMPPCLSYFYRTGAGEGIRNEVLYSMGVFGRKSDRPDLEDFMFQMNFKMIEPPLPAKEVKSIMASVKRQSYQYKCKHPVFKQHCNPETCKRLKFGIEPQKGDDEYDEHMIGCLTKFTTNPVRWRIDINGIEVDFNTEELMNYQKVRCLSMERANIIAPPMKQEDWLLILKERLEHVRIVEAPDDASADGDMMQILSEFIQIAERAQQGREDLLRGIPVKDFIQEMGESVPVIMFRSQDFLLYLKRRKISFNVTGNLLWMQMRSLGVGHAKIRTKNSVIQVWYVPMSPDYGSIEPIAPKLEI